MYQVYACLTESHEPRLVLIAGLICLLGAWTTFGMVERIGASEGRLRAVWLTGGALAIGLGAWSTHFLAMLAFDPGMPVGYDATWTGLSVLVGLVGSALGLAVASGMIGAARPALGGAFVGLAVVLLHYAGMAGLEVPAHKHWHADLVAASILAGSGLAALACRIALGPRRRRRAQIESALLLTLAVCSLHFVGMGALVLEPSPLVPLPATTLSPKLLGAGVAVAATILLLGLAVTFPINRHFAELDRASLRLQQLADATSEGLALVVDGRIVDTNVAMRELMAAGADQLVDQPVERLVLPHQRDLLTHLVADPTGEPTEMLLAPLAAETVPVELLARRLHYKRRSGLVVVARDLRERRRAEASIRHLAHHDALTGLPNRTLFRDRLDQALSQIRRSGGQVAVLCLDLDGFKAVNDRLGHSAGDALLTAVAARLAQTLRETDTVARLGGDEFAIIQHGVAQPSAASALVERLLACFSASFDLGHEDVLVGTSIGVALSPDDALHPDELLRCADVALYRAKAAGRGTYCFFELGMDADLRTRHALMQEFREAIAANQLCLHYLPLADAGSRRIVGFEALVRWNHPDRGLLPPSDFLPLAERSSLVLQLGEWVLRAACREARTWRAPLRVSVNLSPAQFHQRDLPERVARVLEETALAPDRLELEITEEALLRDTQQAFETLGRLKQIGVTLAVDDFGSGYSSLGYLQRFPFDRIKIDQAFVRKASDHAASAAIVRAVIGLARGLDTPVVAEGVETERQLSFLLDQGCDQAQGYLIGRPMPIGHFRELIDLPSPTLPGAGCQPAPERLVPGGDRLHAV